MTAADVALLAHAGEEFLYVLLPAALIALMVWLDRRRSRAEEEEDGPGDAGDEQEPSA